ncbi:MAG: SDR family oxidoreductase [Paenibacillus sp.]|nr:SDR family oxidoreductase [Paenibacillus sp.]
MLSSLKVIITGAASGIGKEIVRHSLQNNAVVIACDFNESALESLRGEMASAKLYTYSVDVSRFEEVTELFSSIEREHPDINGLVNNAGIYLGKNIIDYLPEDINKVLDTNVKGCIYFSQWFGKRILETKSQGVIVNMSSVSGVEGSSDAIYGLSKAAILGLTKSCAMNFSPYIRVNSVAPTMVNTAMISRIPEWRQKEYQEHQLIKEPLSPEDIADTVIFLLSNKSRAYTGATFDINNGCYLR